MILAVEFVEQTCGGCGIVFAFTKDDLKRRTEGKMSFCCPNGCQRRFTGESEADKMRRERDRAVQNNARLEDDLRDEREKKNHARAQVRAYKGVVTKVKKRIGKGVCPCCNRTVKQLAAHMASKHPEYHAEAA